VIPYLDFLLLPGHARNRTQVWGYAKRFYRRVPELVTRVRQGIYNKDAVESLGTENEKATTQNDVPNERRVIGDQRGPTAQKELWEIQFLANLDGKGERWYRATLHREKRILLRLKTDDRTTRYLRFVPFPKAGSMDGYSLVTDVMRTVLEEDTAVRNMRADKAALAIAAPILKNQTALWDEYEQPFGPRSVITVRDPTNYGRWKCPTCRRRSTSGRTIFARTPIASSVRTTRPSAWTPARTTPSGKSGCAPRTWKSAWSC
jgi:hypothetical protein